MVENVAKPVSLSEVKNILKRIEKEREELIYEQRIALEHVHHFAKLPAKKTKELIGTFGTKEETYEDIIKRLYSLAVKEQLRELLMSSEKCIPVKEALEKAKKRWQK